MYPASCGQRALLLALIPILLLPGAAPGQVRREVSPARQLTWQEMLEQTEQAPQADEVLFAPDHGRVIDRPAGKLLDAIPPSANQPIPQPQLFCPGFTGPLSHAGAFGFLGLGDDGTALPPDTMGAVGPYHVMTMLNTQVRILNRSGGLTYSTVGIGTFWAGLNGPFDPKLFYDNLSGRWIGVCLGNRRAANSDWEIIISSTNDPNGTWTSYHFDADGANTRWADFPCVGMNDKWVAVTFNMFAVPGTMPPPATGPKMWVMNKPELLAGGTVGFSEFDIGFDADNGFTLQPAVCLQPGVEDLYILDSSGWTGDPNGNTNWLRMTRITGTAAAPQWSAVPGTNTTKAGFFTVQNRFSNTLQPGQQKDSATALDAGDSRMCNVVYRNGRLWAAHGGGWPADSPDRNAIFWYELQPSLPSPIIQSGIIQSGGPGGGYMYPSVAVNCGNDASIGFSSVSPSIYASACYVTRLAGDAPGTTSNVQYFRDGRAKYVKLDNSSRNRWGDYSATIVDPLDDKTFWTLQEYAELPSGGTDRWAVQWAQITRDCSTPGITQPPQSQDICLGQPATFNVGVNEVSVAQYQWNKNGTPIVGANFYNYTIPAVTLGDAGQFSCTVIGLCKATTSTTATLNVITVPTLESPAFYSSARCPGENAIIIPPVVSGAGPITLQLQRLISGVWTDLPGRIVSPGDGFDFINLQRSDTGDYRVAAINPCGRVYSNAGRIQVGVSFDQQPVSLTRNPCESAGFSVQARGNGPLSYRWRLNGALLADDGRISGATTASLTINGLRYEDEGTYECVVTDNCGPIASNLATLTLPTPYWAQRQTDKPVKRGWSGFAYDAHRRVTVLYGGYGPFGYVNDTWEWNGTTWTQKSPPHTPGKRSNHKMCYDSDRKRIYLWGGIGGELPPISGQLADLWAYDGSDWVLLNNSLVAHNSPYPTSTPEITYDSARGKLVMVRNLSSTTENSETYEYDPDSNQWILKVANNGFPAGYGGAIGYDPNRNRVVHYYGASGGFGVVKMTGRYNGTSWTQDAVTTPQMPFTHMAYDSTRRRLVIFGANYGSTSYYTNSFYDNGSDWAVLLPPGPPASPPLFTSLPEGMAYDSHRRAMVAVLWPYYSAHDAPFETWEYRYLDRPFIDVHPQAQPLTPGSMVSLMVAAVGHGTLAYQWKHNGDDMADGPAPGGGTISGANTPTLTINPVGAADAGAYTCAVSNACGAATSNTAYVGTVPDIAADLDDDGDVDLADVEALNGCALGPEIPQNAPACAVADLDGDGDVDQGDFGLLQACVGGPGKAPPAGCGP